MQNITLGQMSEWLILIVGIYTAIEFLAFRMRKYIKTTMQDEIEPLKNELKENTLNTLKNTICNTNIPISERLEAGKKYIERGGNGGIKIYYHNLEQEYERKLQKEERL